MVLAHPAVVGEVPVDPDAATARRWLQDELTDAVYHDRPSLLERLVAWLGSLFDGGSGAGLDGRWAALGVGGADGVILGIVPAARTCQPHAGLALDRP